MSEKEECPGCLSYTSGVYQAVARGDPCPYCRLSVTAILEVFAARSSHADTALKLRLEKAIVRAGKAESELERLRERLDRISDVIDEDRR